MESDLLSRLSTLSHPGRMTVFRLLMRRCPDELAAGEIAQVLGFKPSTASVYLSALTQTGLIVQRRDGTRLLYGVSLHAARQVVAGLFLDCCQGRGDLCPPIFPDMVARTMRKTGGKFNVLFVCTGNSARSIFAETILRDLAAERFTAYSAGTAQQSDLNPMAVSLLLAKGHDVAPLRSKNIAEFQGADAPRMDFVFTVCDRAANEDCPSWPGPPVSGHWGVPDPVGAQGTEADKRAAFQRAYDALHKRLTAFTDLPFSRLDRGSLQQHIDDIGKTPAPQDA